MVPHLWGAPDLGVLPENLAPLPPVAPPVAPPAPELPEQLPVDRPLTLDDIPWFDGQEPAAGDGDISIEPAAEETHQEKSGELPPIDMLEPFRTAGRWTPEKAGKLVNPPLNLVFEKTGKPKQTSAEEKYTADVFAPVLEDLLSRVDPNSPYGALSLWALTTLAPRYAVDLVAKLRAARGGRSPIAAPEINTSSSRSEPAAPAGESSSESGYQGDWLTRRAG